MTKNVIISISPQEALNILNGNQNLLVRKIVPKNYIGWVYCYCKNDLKQYNKLSLATIHSKHFSNLSLGKVQFRFCYDSRRKYDGEYFILLQNIEIFDNPMKLSDFYKHDYWFESKHRFTPLSSTPKTFQYVWVKDE